MNKVFLMGRLTREPDMRYSGNGSDGMSIARFTLAVDRRRTAQDGQREADFISCVAFGRTADFAGRYLHTGTKILLNGRIQTGNYTNKDGQKVYTTDVIAEEVEFAESRSAQDLRQQSGQGIPQNRGFGQNPYSQNAANPYQAPAQAPYAGTPNREPGRESIPQAQAAAPAANGNETVQMPDMNLPEDVPESSPEEDIPDSEPGEASVSDVGKGFLDIPNGVEDESLPFN